jgi:putative ABC transport system permease protein
MARLSSLAWRSLWARPLRTFLTIVGVALGVAVLLASLTTGATIDSALDRTAADEMGRADLRIQSLEESGLTDATLAVVRQAEGLDVAAPAIERETYLAASPTQSATSPLPAPVTVMGVDPAAEARVHDVPLASGRWLAVTDGKTAVVAQTLADAQGLRVGSTITLSGTVAAGPTPFEIVGIARGDGPLLEASGRLAYVPVTQARALFGITGVTRVDLIAKGGTSADELTSQLEVMIQTQPYLLFTQADLAASLGTETTDFRGALLLVAAVVLFAGAFLIFNTLSMTVAERTREVGLLRAAGTTRGQVMNFIIIQALVLGAFGSILGVVAGFGLGALTIAFTPAAGPIELSGPVVAAGAVVEAILIGMGLTVASAVEPAWRAGLIAPVEAIRRGPAAAARAARLRWLVVVFAVLAFAVLAVWPSNGRSVATNAVAAIAGSSPLSPLAVYGLLLLTVLVVREALRPLLRILSLPFRIFRNEERLARSSLGRDASRTALTAGALVVGVAMVVALGTAAQDMRTVGNQWLTETIPGSELLTSIRPISTTDPVRESLAETAGVKSVSPIGLFGLPYRGVRHEAAAVVGADYLADGRLVFNSGDATTALRGLDAGGSVIVPQSLASTWNLRVGDIMAFSTGTTPTQLKVAAIVAHSIPTGSEEAVLVGWSDALGHFGVTGADFYVVRYAAGQESSARATLDALALSYALQPAALATVEGSIGDALDRILGLLDALAFVAVIIAGLGMVNTYSMSVLERVREIGVLRATGMTSGQVWGMVVVEAGMLGLFGTVVGAAAGLLAGWLLVNLSSAGFGLILDPPWATIFAAGLFGLTVSVAASIYPARLASRLSIVRALRYE